MAAKKARPNKGKGGDARISKQQAMEERVRRKKEAQKRKDYVTPQSLFVFALVMAVLSLLGHLLPRSSTPDAPVPSQTAESAKATPQRGLPLDDTSPEVRRFLSWLESKGADTSKLAVRNCGRQSLVRNNEAECRTVYVKDQASFGETLATLPLSLAFKGDNCELCDKLNETDLKHLIPDAGELPQETQDALLLAVALAHEKTLGDESEYAPWIATLPKSFPQLPSHWSQDDKMFALASPALLQALFGSNPAEVMRRAYAALNTEEYLGTTDFSEDDLVWAIDVINTRSVSVPKQGRVLLPFADLFNVLPVGQAGLDEEDGVVQIKASHSQIGEAGEVFIRISAEASNADLLQQYGFVWRQNPRKTVLLPVPVAENEAMLDALQGHFNVELFKSPSTCRLEKPFPSQQPTVFNRECLVRLRVSFADDVAAERVSAMLEKGADVLSILTLPLSAGSEEQLWDYIAQEARKNEDKYPDKPSRDEKKTWSVNRRNAFKVLREEVAVLEWAQKTADKCPLQLFEDEEIGMLSDDSVASFFACTQGAYGVYTGDQLIDARRGKTVKEAEETEEDVAEFDDDSDDEIDL
ncbi:MAG: hypothetical protein MHM6MM_005418 [Cercozoa sp. M6MM]